MNARTSSRQLPFAGVLDALKLRIVTEDLRKMCASVQNRERCVEHGDLSHECPAMVETSDLVTKNLI